MNLLDVAEKEKCERSFYYFVTKAFKVLEPTTDFKTNWHIRYLCKRLQFEMERIGKKQKKSRDLIINIPPRHMKSLIVTVMLNAWTWTKYPSMKFLCASYSDSLAGDHCQLTRDIIQSPWYQKLWGDNFQLKESTKSMYSNTATGRRESVGLLGSGTGKGCNVLIIDDPLNPKQARSDLERNTANETYGTTFYNRVNDPSIGLRIIIMQRLHAEDLTGHLYKKYSKYYELINFPAELKDNIMPADFGKYYESNVLWNSLFPKEELVKFEENMTGNNYAGQYLQNPVLEGSRIWQPSWFQKWASEMPESHMGYVLSWDTAFKDKAKSDYSSCAIFALLGGGKYILHRILRQKLQFPELKEVNKSLYMQYRPTNILVEDKASGQSLIQELQRDSSIFCPITAIKPNGNKTLRAEIVSPILQQSKVWYYNGDWFADFLEEVSNFPNCAHDDQIDSVSQFLLWSSQLKSQGPQLR